MQTNKLPTPMYQVKNYTHTIKDLDLKQGIITAYASTFDVIDSDGDIMDARAFSKTIAERGPKGANRIMKLLQHNPMQPLGKPMELYTDEKGLVGVTKISDTTYGRDALKLYEDGVLNEHSVGFQTIKSDYDNAAKANRITEVKLWEYSAVTWGANEFTPVISGKSIGTDYIREKLANITKAISNGTYTDETFQILEAQRKHIEAVLNDSLEPEPDSSTPTIQAEQLKKLFTEKQLELTFWRLQHGSN